MSQPEEPTAPLSPATPPTVPIPQQPPHPGWQPPPTIPAYIHGPRPGDPPRYPPPPTAYYAPPPPQLYGPKPPWHKSTAGILTLTFGGIIGACIVACVALAVIGAASERNANAKLTVTPESCTYDSTLRRAEVGFAVTNNGSQTRSASVKIEYRDGNRKRLDTDTGYVRNIAPGDTARSTEFTYLDAPPTGSIDCFVRIG